MQKVRDKPCLFPLYTQYSPFSSFSFKTPCLAFSSILIPETVLSLPKHRLYSRIPQRCYAPNHRKKVFKSLGRILTKGRIFIFPYFQSKSSKKQQFSTEMQYVKQLNSEKWKTYLLTFFDYVALHNMRMSYSQIKPDFQSSFEQSNLWLGLFDALVYLSLGMGFFFRFLLEGRKNLLKSYIIFISIACAAYLVIPVLSIIAEKEVTSNYFLKEILPGLALLVFGFCQFPAWPTLLTLTNEHFNLEKEGTAIGTWSANGDLGNIIGFALAGFLVNGLDCRWQMAMIVAAGIKMIMALCVFFFLKEGTPSANNPIEESLLDEKEEEQSPLYSHLDPNDSKYKFKKFLAFAKETIRPLENKLYLFAFGLLKSILYGFLLWMPTYLTHNQLKAFSSSVPIVFNAGTLVGSSVLGYFYKDHKNTNPDSLSFKIRSHLKSYSLFYSCIGVTLIFVIFYVIEPEIVAYFILSGVSGAFLGGCFNMLAGNEVVSMSSGKKSEVNLLSTFSMFCGNVMVGLVEIVIGVILDLKHDPKGEKKLFIIQICLGVVAILTLFWRSRLVQRRLALQASNYVKTQGSSTDTQ